VTFHRNKHVKPNKLVGFAEGFSKATVRNKQARESTYRGASRSFHLKPRIGICPYPFHLHYLRSLPPSLPATGSAVPRTSLCDACLLATLGCCYWLCATVVCLFWRCLVLAYSWCPYILLNVNTTWLCVFDKMGTPNFWYGIDTHGFDQLFSIFLYVFLVFYNDKYAYAIWTIIIYILRIMGAFQTIPQHTVRQPAK
jgi:hypothetical protein